MRRVSPIGEDTSRMKDEVAFRSSSDKRFKIEHVTSPVLDIQLCEHRTVAAGSHEDTNGNSLLDQCADQVRADNPGRARDQRLHETAPLKSCISRSFCSAQKRPWRKCGISRNPEASS